MANFPRVFPLSLLVVLSACTHAKRAEVAAEQPLHATQAQAVRAGDPAQVSGRLRMIIGDDFARRQTKTLCQLVDDQTGKVYDLKLADAKDASRCRGRAKVSGVRGASATDIEQSRIELEGGASAAVVPPVTGVLNTLVIIADFQNESVGCSRQSINDLMFGATDSVAGLYREMTSNQIRVQGQVVGPYRINVTSPAATCPWSDWDAQARALAQADGVNVAMYEKIVYIYGGSPGSCPGVGWAFIPGRDISLLGSYCAHKGTYAHELGHSIGMHHAASFELPGSQYGDFTDIMGGTSSLHQVNGAHRAQMGWTPTQKIQTVTTSGVYRLSPLALDAAAATQPQLIRIAKPDDGHDYWLSYRQPIGYDASIANMPFYGNRFVDGVAITQHLTGQAFPEITYYVKTLNDEPSGRVFHDAVNRIRITQLAHDSSGVTFEVNFNDESTPDTQSPVATISYPLAGASVVGIVPISVNATDNTGVVKVEFYVDGDLKGTDASAPFVYDWDATDLALVGMHSIQAKAYDAAGNVGASNAQSVRVNAAPVMISGKVTQPNGSTGLVNTRVNVTDLSTGQTYSANTSSFGLFSVPAPVRGKPVVITVVSKRYRFAPKTLTPAADVSSLLFIALE